MFGRTFAQRGTPPRANRISKSQLLGAISVGAKQATNSQRSMAVLMLAIKPKDRLRALTQDFIDERIARALNSIVALLRPADRYCPVGASQLCLVLRDLANPAQALLAAHMLARAGTEALATDPHEAWARVLVGVSCSESIVDADTFLLQADAALTQAEATEDGIWRFANHAEDKLEGQQLAAQTQILESLRSNDFHVAFQPQLDLASGRFESAEALLRPRFPDGRPMPPPWLVSAAEAEGRVTSLTTGVLNAALRQARSWARAGLNMRVSVNLSTQDLREPSFPEVVAQSLKAWGVGGPHLTLEIVESSMVHSFTEAASILLQLKELGVRIAIDDFGTGYSCLAYLPRLPLDELKIDRAFVRRLHESKDDRRLVQGIIDLAHNLELEAVAEGVEDEGARQVLQDMGCDLIQGHLLTPALDAEAFIDWVRKRNP